MTYHTEPSMISITLGTVVFADPELPRPNLHIFCQERASWVVLPYDGARRCNAFTAEFQEMVDRRRAGQQLPDRLVQGYEKGPMSTEGES